MTPKELMEKHRIPRTLLPELLRKSYRQVDRYLVGNIPSDVEAQCFLIDYYLCNGGNLQSLLFLEDAA